jgi:hypothetical protein
LYADIIEKVKRPPPLIRPSVSKGAAPPEAINIMRQCWAEQADMRPDFNAVHDLFKKLNHGRYSHLISSKAAVSTMSLEALNPDLTSDFLPFILLG